MIAKLRMKLEIQAGELSFHYGSLMQGVLMEKIDSSYAGKMHSGALNPYSQAIYQTSGQYFWEINALNQEAKEEILDVIAKSEEFFIKKKNQRVKVTEKTYSEVKKKELVREFYEEEAGNLFKITFFTPTAFKQKGQYTFVPDIRCIYQSLMNKYDAATSMDEVFDEDMLECLTEHTTIQNYNLRSVRFGMEGTAIPAFVGTLTLKVSAQQTIVNFANLLFTFANYCGIGIKTSIGMGKVEIEQVRRRRSDKTTE